MNNFLKTRKALLAMTPEEIKADVKIEGVQGDNDQSRLYVVLNTAEWVKTAHGCLDSYNQFDNAMLGKMADYVKKIKLLIGAEQFFSPPSDEVRRKAIFPTRDEIILVRIDSDVGKREREEESDDSFLPPAAVRGLPQERMITSDTSTENVPEQLVAPGAHFVIPTGIRRDRSRKRAPTSSVSYASPAMTIMQPTASVS